MYKIQQITTAALQTQSLVLPDGTSIKFTIAYVPLQFGWFIRELTYGNLTINNMRICTSPNMLYQFINQLPFGLACFVVDNREPTQQEDFASGNANLYILTVDEVAAYKAVLLGG